MGGFYRPIKDNSKRTMVRTAITESGWAYLSLNITIKPFLASGGIRCKKLDGTDYTFQLKYYDSEYGGSEVTGANIPTQAKRMELLLDIGIDYEIVKGQTFGKLGSECYMDVANGFAYQGDTYVKPFVLTAPLHLFDNFQTDGKAPKRLDYNIDTVPGLESEPANVFKIYFRRPTAAAVTWETALGFEFYRE